MSKKHNRFRANMPKEQLDQLQGTEIKAKRTRFGKVYALGGNRFQAVTYTDPVHRYNEGTHEWDEIDNRFAATPRMKTAKATWKQGKMPKLSRGEALLECKTGNLNVACSMSGEAPFITLTNAAGQKLSWGIENAMSILPEAVEVTEEKPENVRRMRENVMSHLRGEVIYEGIFAGVDLRCKLGRGFKDELVFVEQESVRPVTFLLESEGREMELTDDNALIVKDAEGKAVFRLQAPFVVDADKKRGAVAVQLGARENGVYAMTYTPDAAFMAEAAYPVVLDPAVETTQTDGGIVDTYVTELQSADNSNDDELWTFTDSWYGTCYSYIKITDLPSIGPSDFITGASLFVHNAAALSGDTPLLCREVTEAWDPQTVTYADHPEMASEYQDYCLFPQKSSDSSQTYVWRELDLTSLAMKWYQGEANNGVAFTPRDGAPNTVILHSTRGAYPPYFVVNYASLAGLESYLSYDQQSAGLAGTGYVSLANGNLVFAHTDTSMNGNLMPVSVTHFYNSCDAYQDEFGLGYGWRTNMHQTLHMERINGENVYVYTDGDGTVHFFEQDEESESVQYVDMSGLGLKLTVATAEGDTTYVITIKNKNDDCMTFNFSENVPEAEGAATEKVLVSEIRDACNNTIVVTARVDYPLYIAFIRDGANRYTAYSYTNINNKLMCTTISNGMHFGISNARFEYDDNGCLKSITHEDGRESHYRYTAVGDYHLLTYAYGEDGMAVGYEYSNVNRPYGGLPHCVIYSEAGDFSLVPAEDSNEASASDGSVPATLFAQKNRYIRGNHLTLVTNELSAPNDEFKTIRYHFNDNGNQVSIDDDLGYASFTLYDQSGDNENTPINHATSRSRMQRVVKNLLTDSMFQGNSSAWERSSTSNVTRDASTFHFGIVSWKLKATGNGSYLKQSLTLEPGKSYTYSGYLRSSAENTFLRIIYKVGDDEKHVDSDPVKVYSAPSGKPFDRVAVSFTLPTEASADVDCYIMCVGSGYGWVSSVQLEEGLTCNHFNMVQEQNLASISTNTSATYGWRVNKDTPSAYVSTKPLKQCRVTPPSYLAGNALHFESHYNPECNLIIEQEIRHYVSAGDRFTVGGWCSTHGKKHDEDGTVRCCIDVLFKAGSYWISGGKAIFNYEEGNWQFASGSVIAPHNCDTLLIRVDMSRQINTTDVAGLYLYPEPFGADYVYDSKGNRTTARQLYGGVSAAEYDDADNMKKYTAPGHTLSSTFGYGDSEEEQKKHLLRSSESPLGTRGQYSYDDKGNAKRSDMTSEREYTDESGNPYTVKLITRNTVTYRANKNYIHMQTDARGKTVTTEVDENKGITTSVKDPKGQVVNYAYDTLRRVTNVSTSQDLDDGAGIRNYHNEYTYDQTRGLLTSVKHNVDDDSANDVVYTFEYDALGRKTKVLVGNETLSENVYQNDTAAANYGTLTQMKYGNRTVVKNEYDDFNRIIGIRYGTERENSEEVDFEEQLRYKYDYNANGQVAHVKNNELAHVTESEYDLSNRPCRVKTHKMATADNPVNEHIYTGEVAYDDAFGRLTEFTEKVGATCATYSTAFGYDEENRPTSLNYGGYGSSTLTYDGLGRVEKATVKAGNGEENEIKYTYIGGAALEKTGDESLAGITDAERIEAAENAKDKTSTTGLVASIQQTGGNFTYEYDDNGNITKVTQDTVDTEYTYDALGQLIRVDDGQENATWVYTYDQGGNILSKKKYALGVTSGTATESKVFTYGNTKWRDQLTAVNGVGITYDAIGNPLNDGTWTYTWQNGRQLKKMQKSGETVEFIYNENGLRVQKTATSTGVTKYTLHGKNIVHMTQGSNDMHFFYDAQNKPAVVVYNGTPYTYVKNLQGDIVAILDSTGSVVVEYKYDAWGRIISKTGSLASTLGTVQPFRYRGYVFDEEIGLYYLRSRYYIPSLCRFINSDSLLSTNLFAYCNNQPTLCVDSNGTRPTFAAMCLRECGSSYLSPSKQTPEAVLEKNHRGKNKGKIPVGYLLAYLDQMVAAGDWKYAYGKMAWKAVDCVGMIRNAYQQYSQKLAEKTSSWVGGVRSAAIKAGFECLPVDGNEGELVPGMAIYWYDPDNKNEDGELRPWDHIGIYVGSYRDPISGVFYSDAVIEASSGGKNVRSGVIARSLRDITAGLPADESLHFSYLSGVEY